MAPGDLLQNRDKTIASAELKVGKMNKAQILGHQVQSIMFVLGLALLVGSRGYQPFRAIFQDNVIYSCTDSRTKLPVFFKINSEGLVMITAHYRDGQVYVIGGNLQNYSRILGRRGEIGFDARVSHDSVGLDPGDGLLLHQQRQGRATLRGDL